MEMDHVQVGDLYRNKGDVMVSGSKYAVYSVAPGIQLSSSFYLLSYHFYKIINCVNMPL